MSLPTSPPASAPTRFAPSPRDFRYVVPGDLLSTNVDEFRSALATRIEQLANGTELVIDFRASRLIDSVGLNQLVTAIKAAKARGATVRLLVGTQSVRRILTFTRIDSHATVEGPLPA